MQYSGTSYSENYQVLVRVRKGQLDGLAQRKQHMRTADLFACNGSLIAVGVHLQRAWIVVVVSEFFGNN